MEANMTIGQPELWGGIECTINRIGNEYKDQLLYSGHYDRHGDIETIADLGIQAIRYPVLWEKHQPQKDCKINWSWSRKQLQAIRKSGMKPIVGLLHHGSGPAFTHLLDPEFPYLMASYAYEVACQFPWIEDYTPVNEPLTTARFSGLYGLWYPHHQTEISFYRMLIHQLKATVLCMEAIRSVNPAARLIQTEDLGKTHSTDLLRYQADFENDRRLLTFDLLTGRLVEGHPQYQYMLSCGIAMEELQFFQDHICIPDILGLNYYVTSERWLDQSLDKYPHEVHGGNGRHRYADTEVVRAHHPARLGFQPLATEIWKRYQLPMAVTEAHLHCTREEQLRWFNEIWNDARELARQGIDMRAVTAWALLGSFDWDTLLTKTGTQYESGVFDIKTFTGLLRPTAMVSLIKAMQNKGGNFHPVLSAPGWWQHTGDPLNDYCDPLLIVADTDKHTGSLSDSELFMFINACQARRITVRVVSKPDITEPEQANAWGIIDLCGTANDLRGHGIHEDRAYVCFNNEEETAHCLNIIVEQLPMTIHQVNKILDLMIDGDQGSWIFGRDEVIYKTEHTVNKYQIA